MPHICIGLCMWPVLICSHLLPILLCASLCIATAFYLKCFIISSPLLRTVIQLWFLSSTFVFIRQQGGIHLEKCKTIAKLTKMMHIQKLRLMGFRGFDVVSDERKTRFASSSTQRYHTYIPLKNHRWAQADI